MPRTSTSIEKKKILGCLTTSVISHQQSGQAKAEQTYSMIAETSLRVFTAHTQAKRQSSLALLQRERVPKKPESTMRREKNKLKTKRVTVRLSFIEENHHDFCQAPSL